MCMVTSRRVGCGCTVCSFTTLGECELSLSLGLRPMKTHSSNQELKKKKKKLKCVGAKQGGSRKSLKVRSLELG